MGQSTERGKSCRYPAYTGVGFKTQTLQEQKKKSVQLKAETSVTFFYDLPVQILGRERNRAGQKPGIYVFERDLALMGPDQSVQGFQSREHRIGKADPFQIFSGLFF